MIHSKKRMETLDTPLLLMECRLADGSVERMATHRVTVEGHVYEARLLRHSGFDLRLAGDDGVDAGSRFTLTLSNVDGRVSQIDRTVGWKGAKLTVRFGFFDVATGLATSELTAVYLGVANPVEELRETTARVSFTNRLNLQRVQVPGLRIESRCPWRFPETAEERAQAQVEYTAAYGCGYGPDVEGGAGNLNGVEAYGSCGRTRGECEARGMYRTDGEGRATARFGGFAFLPPSVMVRPHGEKSWTLAESVDGRAKANDAVPLVYGTAWIAAPVVFSRNDGNLTHCEAVVGTGPIEGVQRVVVNGVQLPLGVDGQDMTASGWYSVVSTGTRNGAFNADFKDASGVPAGDPHGGVAVLGIVIPNGMLTSAALPKVQVLVDGLRLQRYDGAGAELDRVFTRNPAWVLLDLLRRSGWRLEELDLASFAATAAYCDEFIEAALPDGGTEERPRFQLNVALMQRRSLSEVLKGLRLAAALQITVGGDGLLRLTAESTLTRQSPQLSEVSNSTQPVAGGWPAYEFGDGLNGFSAIIRDDHGGSTFRMFRRAASEMPNRVSVEFQDTWNDYQTDSLSLVDYEDASALGCEVAVNSGALGLPGFDQAARVVRLQIQKNVAGNLFVEFDTSVQALGLRPGDIVCISHGKEGLDRAPFRILRLTPGLNYERTTVLAQRHEDGWYELASGEWTDREGQPEGGLKTPRPLRGTVLRSGGGSDFSIEESAAGDTDVELTVRFTPPDKPATGLRGVPVVSASPQVMSGEGTLAGGQGFYYGISGVDAAGGESSLSVLVHALLPEGAGTYGVKLRGLKVSGGAVAMRVYRGPGPRSMAKIAETAVAAEFIDSGLAEQVTPAPDANYDHARFQWRFELRPETTCTLHGASTIGAAGLGMQPNEFAGTVVRLTSGRGGGAERRIVSNDATTLVVTPPWTVEPDGSTKFAIAEAGWKTAGVTRSDEIDILVPGLSGEWVEVMGLAVNALGVESPVEEALVSRHRVAGSGSGSDADVPPMPGFGLTTAGRGSFEIGGIGFETLENTRTVKAGTLTVYAWDERQSPCTLALATALTATATFVGLTAVSGAVAADVVQVGPELMRVLEVSVDGLTLEVERGIHESGAVSHATGAAVYLQARHTYVLPFAEGLFESASAGSWSQVIELEDARIAAAELYLTNDRGAGPTYGQSLTNLADGGLRTMSGGQYTLQWDGLLALAAGFAPPLVVDATHAVRYVQARVGVAPLVEPVVVRVRVNGEVYCVLTIAAGAVVSNVVNGFGKAPLGEGDVVTADIAAVGTGGGSFPGKNLTVTIRL